MPQFSSDGGRVYYRRPNAAVAGEAGTATLIERDLGSGDEREVLRDRFNGFHLSPDGTSLAVRRLAADGTPAAISLVAAKGDPAVRDLLRTGVDGGLGLLGWSPDGRAVLANRPQLRESLWLPVKGGEPRRLDRFVQNPSIHPDGKRIAYQVGSGVPSTREIWVMENFLPPAPTQPNRRP